MTDYNVSDSTLKILKNFAAISSSVRLRKGTTQRTVSSSKSMMAIAEFDAAWPMETPIYQLPELMSNLGQLWLLRLEHCPHLQRRHLMRLAQKSLRLRLRE